MGNDIIDLSHPVHEDMPVYPGDNAPVINVIATIENEGYRETELIMSSHTGTHVDAPAHIIPGGKTLDSFPAEKFFGNGIMIDCNDEKVIYKDHLLRAINSVTFDFVLLFTGCSALWGSEKYYQDIPLIDTDAARYLSKLSPKGIGIDTPSFDPIGSDELTNHKLFLGNDILLIENLTSLGKLSGKQFQFCCAPLNIKDSDGSPVRAFAIV